MPAQYSVTVSADPKAQTVTFQVFSVVAPATDPAVFKVAGSPAAGTPKYLGVCTVPELSALPNSPPADPASLTPYRSATTVVPATADSIAAVQVGVYTALQTLSRAVDKAAGGRTVTGVTVNALGWS